jgi:hypothetical protein
METTIDTKSTITLFDRANSWLQNTIFFYTVTTIGYALSPAMNKSLHAALVKICTSGGGRFTARTTAPLLGKFCPRSPSFIGPKRLESAGAKSGATLVIGKNVAEKMYCSYWWQTGQ